MQSQGRDGREQGDASRQAKPAVPQFVPVNDEIMTEASQAPLPDDIPPAEYDWKVVHYKNKRSRKKPTSPIPPSPPPARPDLRDKMWHTHKYVRAPELETRHSLRSSRIFNQTPTEANFRNERVGQNEARHRAARHQEHERRRHQSMPPARSDLRNKMWHDHKYVRAPEVEPRHSLRSARDFNLVPTEANYRRERVGRSESRRREARDREHERRRPMSPLQDLAAGQQGVSKTQKQGPKPVPSSLQDRDMMSIDNRSMRGGSKGVRKNGASKRTDRTPRRGDARSITSNNYRSRSGSRRKSATRSRSASATSRRHRPA